MLIPISQPLDRPVLLVRATPTPIIRTARLTFFDGERFRLVVDGPERDLSPGNTVVLDFGEAGPSRCRARVEVVDGKTLEVRPKEALQRRDRRDHPRVAAELPVAYRVLTEAERAPERRESLALRAHLSAAGERFREPDPFVDVSGTGLRFIDSAPPAPGDQLLLRIRFAPDEPFRGAIAEVVRIDEEVPGEWSVATTFLEVAPDAYDALLAFITRRQEALLGISPEG